jgi:DNA invertase Pin-like site-specific DNA recombinase
VPATTTNRQDRRTARGAVGYASVAGEAALDGPEVEAQRHAIEAACEGLGLELVALARDRLPAAPAARSGLEHAFAQLGAGEASCLVISELGRLTGDVAELAAVLERVERDAVRLVVIDVGLDTATPSGRLAIARTDGVAAPPPAEPEPEPQPEPAPVAVAPAPPPAEPEPEPDAAAGVRALGYASIALGQPGAELDAQKDAIEATARRLGLDLVQVVREREPKAGRALDRAGLSYLVGRLAAGEAACVVTSGLDRISRSVSELGTIVQWLDRNGVRLVVCEIDLDTASPAGRATAQALAAVAGWERERISERTRKGLAAARARRHAAAGATDTDWNAVRMRIARMRADGMTLQAIADALNADGVPTQRGGSEWRPSSVQTAAGYKRRPKAKDLPGSRPPE